MSGADNGNGVAVAETKPPTPGRETRELLKRAVQGDEGSRQTIRALFADGDRGRHLVESIGSSAVWVKQAIVKKAAGENIAAQEAIFRKIEAVRAELAGPDPTPMERLLAERAALCWMMVNWYETNEIVADRLSIAQATYYQRKIDRAHSRFLSAVRTLAQVRKLALPTLQLINIAKNQVNVAETRP